MTQDIYNLIDTLEIHFGTVCSMVLKSALASDSETSLTSVKHIFRILYEKDLMPDIKEAKEMHSPLEFTFFIINSYHSFINYRPDERRDNLAKIFLKKIQRQPHRKCPFQMMNPIESEVFDGCFQLYKDNFDSYKTKFSILRDKVLSSQNMLDEMAFLENTEKQQHPTHSSSQLRLGLNLSVPEVAFLMRLFYDEGLIITQHKTELSKQAAGSMFTKNQNNISWKSLKNHLDNPETKAVDNFYQILRRILTNARKYKKS